LLFGVKRHIPRYLVLVQLAAIKLRSHECSMRQPDSVAKLI
jgi:hypothetical protein